jgi:ribose 5-phosphate isomerase RpiB
MTTTRVALGADHAGVELKQLLMDRLHDVGYLTVDVGTHGDTPVDYAGGFATPSADAYLVRSKVGNGCLVSTSATG